MKKLFCLLLCLVLLIPAATSCSKPPEYSEIEARFIELVEASYEINEIFFGKGLATYERTENPKDAMQAYTDAETGVLYHYYRISDATEGEVLALRQATTTKVFEDPDSGKKYFYFTAYDRIYGKIMRINPQAADESSFYLQIFDAPVEGKTAIYEDSDKNVYGYLLENYEYEQLVYLKEAKTAREGETPYYHNESTGTYYYQLHDYTEPVYESYYDSSDPFDYDYVRPDTGYLTIMSIKEKASLVYSAEYLNSLYGTIFDGAAGVTENSKVLSPRYTEYTDSDTGTTWLMKSNTVEPLITERRLYDFSTAKMVSPKNAKYVTIEIESYLESNPSARLTVRIGMKLQNGTWMLDTATY